MKDPTPFRKWPDRKASAKMPTDRSISVNDHNTEMAARIGSEALRDKVRKLLGLRPWQ